MRFDDETKCKQFYVDAACYGGGKADFDYAVCETKIQAAACVAAGTGDVVGVLLPEECTTN